VWLLKAVVCVQAADPTFRYSVTVKCMLNYCLSLVTSVLDTDSLTVSVSKSKLKTHLFTGAYS